MTPFGRSAPLRGSVVALSAALLACSSGSTQGGSPDGGSSGPSGTRAVPQGIVQAKLVAGASGTCSAPGQTLALGAFNPPTPVADRADDPRGTVDMFCQVAPLATGFRVNTLIDFSNPGVGAIALVGETSATGMATTSFTVSFRIQNTANSSYESSTCVLDPSAVTGGGGGIAAGRYWTTFHCTQGHAINAAGTAHASGECDIEGEIRLENCQQE
jgi:hypothetical protein